LILLTKKGKLLFLDSCIMSMCVSMYAKAKEGLCSTDNGSIFFINFSTNSSFKIISSHSNCIINTIVFDNTNDSIITAGEDGTLRCWSQDTYDQKFEIYQTTRITKCMINTKDNLCIVQYDMLYLKVYDLSSLLEALKFRMIIFQISLYFSITLELSFIVMLVIKYMYLKLKIGTNYLFSLLKFLLAIISFLKNSHILILTLKMLS
jgi:hypothetical protein